MTTTAAPCIECGTTGGTTGGTQQRPSRRRGYCANCYLRLWRANKLGNKRVYFSQYRCAPCLSCGIEHSHEARGLCKPCYGRAHGQGIVTRYPACGAVPVPHLDMHHPEHPDMPPPLDAAAFGHFLWHDAEGNRAQAGVWGPKWHPSAEIARDETFAAAWMRAHPAQAILWDDPSLALFPASEARAA